MKLSTYLETTGKSIPTLAGEIGVSSMALRYWAKRQRTPRPEMMAKIAAATNGAVQPNDFFDTEAAE